jgi:serine/threonine-protein kinase
VTFTSTGLAEGTAFGVRPVLAGTSLRELLAHLATSDRSIPAEVAARIGIVVLEPLVAIHRLSERGRPAYHGDLTPNDVRIAPDGTVRLTTSCLAVAAARADAVGANHRNVRLAYKAPEQLIDSGTAKSIDSRADSFALGVVLWESVEGRRLFDARSAAEMLERVIAAPIPALSSPRLPPELAAVITRALERTAETRATLPLFLESLKLVPGTASLEQASAWLAHAVADLESASGKSLSAGPISSRAPGSVRTPTAATKPVTEAPSVANGPPVPAASAAAAPTKAPAMKESEIEVEIELESATPTVPVAPVAVSAPPARRPKAPPRPASESDVVQYVAPIELPKVTSAPTQEPEARIVLNVPGSGASAASDSAVIDASKRRQLPTVKLTRDQVDALRNSLPPHEVHGGVEPAPASRPAPPRVNPNAATLVLPRAELPKSNTPIIIAVIVVSALLVAGAGVLISKRLGGPLPAVPSAATATPR